MTLVGRGTYDYRDLRGFGDNLVPTLLVGSPDGLVASDVAFADLSGDDGIPEIALGRLPVVTAADSRTTSRRSRPTRARRAASGSAGCS